MKINWVCVYRDGLEIIKRIDICDSCLEKYYQKYGENNVCAYDSERAGSCEECGKEIRRQVNSL